MLGWPQVLRLRVNDTGAPQREPNRGHSQGDAEGLELRGSQSCPGEVGFHPLASFPFPSLPLLSP